jgi:hypothetical protein
MQFDAEGAILRATLGLIRQKSTVVCFLSYHGQFALEGPKAALFLAKDLLEKDLYQVKTINLMREGKVDETCGVVVEAGQSADLSQKEKDLLADYVNRGGSLWVNLEKGLPDMPNWQAFMKELGVAQLPGVLVNPNLGEPYSVFPLPTAHDAAKALITKLNLDLMLKEKLDYPQMGFVYPLEVVKDLPVGREAAPVLETAEGWFADMEMGREDPPTFSNKDKAGKFFVGMAATTVVSRKDRLKPQSRVLVYGDAMWMVDQAIAFIPANQEMLVRGMAWLANDAIKVKAAPKAIGQITFSLSPMQVGLVRFMVFFLLPGLLVVFGVQSFLRNRKK